MKKQNFILANDLRGCKKDDDFPIGEPEALQPSRVDPSQPPVLRSYSIIVLLKLEEMYGP